MEKNIIRIYKPEEMEVINHILGKDKENKWFNTEELEFVNKFDLYDKAVINLAKIIWKYRDNRKALDWIKKVFEAEEIETMLEGGRHM